MSDPRQCDSDWNGTWSDDVSEVEEAFGSTLRTFDSAEDAFERVLAEEGEED